VGPFEISISTLTPTFSYDTGHRCTNTYQTQYIVRMFHWWNRSM